MAKMTNAQLAAENAVLRSKLEEMRATLHGANLAYDALLAGHNRLQQEFDELDVAYDYVAAECDEMRIEIADLRGKIAAQRSATPAWQLGAQQRRAQYDAAVAQGRRVKFVGNVLVDY